MSEADEPALSASTLRGTQEFRRAFRADEPLPDFLVVEGFLEPVWIARLLSGIEKAEFGTFGAYTPTGKPDDMRFEFHEPSQSHCYVTIHQRPRQPIPELIAARAAMAAPATVRALAALTGLPLRALSELDALTCWGPGSFIGRHSDSAYGRSHQLAVSLSLTRAWTAGLGGLTTFAWEGLSQSVTLTPSLNTAALFVPNDRSAHWVSQVEPSAPPRTRYTWTLFYL
jgi:hypothetical protein